ncbi:MAG: zinc-binding alcohol dehydrogenase family protein [Acidobacteria bacterium]|nr:zinc-binding alcohol dehydrogenase family protein [Acidobacteriota bacterium]
MVLSRPAAGALEEVEREIPVALPGEVLVKVHACGVCRTDLHVVDGELLELEIPLVPGHEIVWVVECLGDGVSRLAVGDRVGIPWLGYSCGECPQCREGRENLCVNARFTGYTIDGGYADYTVADARYTFKLPDSYADLEAAPLLCAGLIGYRSYRMAGDVKRLGLYGFGAAAHIIAQVAVHDGREIYAFTSPDDTAAQEFARGLGVTWAGASTEPPPEPLDAAIIFAPVGKLIPEALSHVAPGGIVVCAGIHMSDVPSFPYRLLWEERVVRSVANLTRQDAREFLALAAKVPIKTRVERYDLADANQALSNLRDGQIQGAAVLMPSP